MVKKEYRDFFTFYETERACWPCLRGIGCKLLFGFPRRVLSGDDKRV